MHHPPDRITHTTTFVTPVVEHWLEQETDQWVHRIHEQMLLPAAISRSRTQLDLRSGLELRTGLGLEWYLGLGCDSLFQYNGEVQAKIVPTFLVKFLALIGFPKNAANLLCLLRKCFI